MVCGKAARGDFEPVDLWRLVSSVMFSGPGLLTVHKGGSLTPTAALRIGYCLISLPQLQLPIPQFVVIEGWPV